MLPAGALALLAPAALREQIGYQLDIHDVLVA